MSAERFFLPGVRSGIPAKKEATDNIFSISVLPHSLICSAVHGRRFNMEKIVSWFAWLLSFLWFGLIGKKRNQECMS